MDNIINYTEGKDSNSFEIMFPDDFDADDDSVEASNVLDFNVISPKIGETVAHSVKETKMFPMTVTSDSYTASQVILLLGMIRYCMEKSSEVIDSKDGESKEFNINVKIKNRNNSKMIISIGDESIPPIPYVKDVYIGV